MTVTDEILSEKDFRVISDLVYRHCGINLHDGKRELVQARIAKKLRTGGFGSASQYIQHVIDDKSGLEFADLIDSLSTNLTSFFRENNHFQYLSTTLLPALIEQRKKSGQRRVLAWSAGCSTGEEPHTLAIVLSEALADTGLDALILATDISRRVLNTAIAGVYEQSRIASVPQPFQRKYFVQGPDKGSVRASDDLRRMIRFNYLNLQENWPFSGPFDFIFCRNVMIYFDKPTQEKLVNRFHSVLAPGGVLFTGHSESLTGVNHKFRYVQPTIYAK